MKRYIAMILVLATVLVLSACGTSNASAAQPEPQSAGTASQPAENQVGAAPEAEAATEPQVPTAAEAQNPSAAPEAGGESKMITEEEAKKIALEDAGVTEDQLGGLYIHMDRDDGIQVYDVEFFVGAEEYDYEINASDGSVVSKDREVEHQFRQQGIQAETTGTFTEADAIALVLGKVPGATEDLVHIHLDQDDGMKIYEGSLHYDGMEYDFEINAETGDIMEWEEEKQEPFDFD